MTAYFDALKKAILQNHGCDSRFEGIVPVAEIFDGRIAWEGEVISFDLMGHPKARRCYAWGHKEGGEWEITTVLKIPPVTSAATAVKAAIAAASKG